ncbi:hypothetical protein HAX54_018948 [Datura stramonium]|uniref:Inhibitor I9 domain-containing protein n=1 Tax=Datura stramonium TaxID=4076 RepID=A0ABS8UQC8_DATST|nr:hypothetical protein [Datura stramonium]
MSRFVIVVVVLLVLLGLSHVSVGNAIINKKSTFIIHKAKSQMPESFEDHTHWYDSSLKSVSDSTEMFYVYNNAIHDFSARLTVQEAESLQNQPGILWVLPDLKYELHTTKTSSFSDFDRSDVTIGVLDRGVWPESKNFDDNGFGTRSSFMERGKLRLN